MNRAKSFLVFLALSLTFSPGGSAAAPPPGGTEIKQNAPPPASMKAVGEKPFVFSVRHKGDRVVLRLDRAPEQVEILSRTTSLHNYQAQGKTDFDLTPFVPKAHRGTLLVKAWTVNGSLFQEIVRVAPPPPLTAPAARSVVPVVPAPTMQRTPWLHRG